MNLKTFIVIGCIFSACAKPPAYVKSADDVTKSFSEKMLRENALISLGAGGYYHEKSVNALYADYELFQPYSKEEAKALLTQIIPQFVDHINTSEEIRPYLQTYPVTSDQVSISIAFFDQDHNPYDKLAQIHLYQGKLYYSTYDREKKAYLAVENEKYKLEKSPTFLK